MTATSSGTRIPDRKQASRICRPRVSLHAMTPTGLGKDRSHFCTKNDFPIPGLLRRPKGRLINATREKRLLKTIAEPLLTLLGP